MSNRSHSKKSRSAVAQRQSYLYETLEPKNLLAGDLTSDVATAYSPNSLVYTVDAPVDSSQQLDLLREHLDLERLESLQLLNQTDDALGFSHFRYQQMYNGMDVVGGVYSAHVKDGQVVQLSGDFKDVGSLQASALIAASTAFQNALDSIGAELYAWETVTNSDTELPAGFEKPEGELVLLQLDDGSYAITYQFDVFALEPFRQESVFVDASSGKVVENINLIQTADVAGTGIALYDGEVDITVNDTGTEFQLNNQDPFVHTYDANNFFNIASATETTNDTANFDSDSPAVQLHYGLENVDRMLAEWFNYDSYDNLGSELIGYHSFGVEWFNAFWSRLGHYSAFGDGIIGDSTPLVSLDIVGHEVFHGVTQFSANMSSQNEPGALNESFSDIFGKVLENYVRGSNNWLVGDEIGLFGSGAFRNMENPNDFNHPDTYQGNFWFTGTGDNGGVHTNSGVQNKWFQLLTDGGAGVNDNGDGYDVPALGLEVAAQITFRNLTVYMTPDAEYFDSRVGSLQAAADLYGLGSPEQLAVAEAWDAVGVYDPFIAIDTPEFEAADVRGSQVYTAQTTQTLGEVRHLYNIEVDANQTLAVKVTTTEGLQATVAISTGPSLAAFGNTDEFTGSVVLQSVPLLEAGTYEVEVRANGEVEGDYNIEFWLNSDIESEGAVDGLNNDSFESAQAIDTSSTSVGRFVERLAVGGSLTGDGSVEAAHQDDFESGTLQDNWTTTSSTETGRVRVTGDHSTGEGDFALILDQENAGEFNLNEAIWAVDVGGLVDPVLTFAHAEFNDETHPLPQVFSGSFNGDGVAISEDGETWFTILTDTEYENGVWITETYELSDLAAKSGLSFTGMLYVKFQQYDDHFVDTDGRGYDAIAINVPNTGEDWYSFETLTDQPIAAAVAGVSEGTVRVDLFDSVGNRIRSGIPDNNLAISSSYATQVLGDGNTIYARVRGVTDYSLVVTRGADFDQPGNDTTGTAQNIDGVPAAYGYVADIDASVAEPDTAEAAGDVLDDFFVGLELSNEITGGSVFAGDGADFGAPTGDKFFAADPMTNQGWRDGINVLRAEFAAPQAVVSIDVGSDDDSDQAYLRAYDAEGTFLEQVFSSELAEGESETLTISRSSADIAYILAAGIGGDHTPLDNLLYEIFEFDQDYYEVSGTAGEHMLFQAILPGRGEFLFDNDLDTADGPAVNLELIAGDGTVLASGTELLEYTPEESGNYYIRVFANFNTSGEYVLLNAVDRVIPDLEGVDFGPLGSDVFEGFVGVTDEVFSPFAGYGWTEISSQRFLDGNRGDALTKDRIGLRTGTFETNVVNGTYEVTVRFGIVGRVDNLTITAEGMTDVFAPQLGPNVSRTYTVEVTDGTLTMEFDGRPGLTNRIRLAGLEISQQLDRPSLPNSGNNSPELPFNPVTLGSKDQIMPVELDDHEEHFAEPLVPREFSAIGLKGSNQLFNNELDQAVLQQGMAAQQQWVSGEELADWLANELQTL